MTNEEFVVEFNKLKNQYGFCWRWSCDLISIADLEVYVDKENEAPIVTIEVDTSYGCAKGIEDIRAVFNNRLN